MASRLKTLIDLQGYLRYHPEAERFLQLGDFRFFRLDPLRIRVVGGFAQAGWLEGKQLIDAPFISLEDEAHLIESANSPFLIGSHCSVWMLTALIIGQEARANALCSMPAPCWRMRRKPHCIECWIRCVRKIMLEPWAMEIIHAV